MTKPTMDSDPSGAAGGLVTVIAAAIALLVAFGVPLSPEQEEGILRFLVVAGPPLTAYLIRRKAWSPAAVETEIAKVKAETKAEEADKHGAEIAARLEGEQAAVLADDPDAVDAFDTQGLTPLDDVGD